MIDDLKEDVRLQMSALVSRYFRIDPVKVLESNYWDWAVRVAALQYASEEEKKASDRASKSKYTADSRVNRIG